MKKWIYIAGIALVSFLSCNKSETASSPSSSEGDNLSTVTISLRKSSTKATSITTPFEADLKIKSVDVFIFEGVADDPSADPVTYHPGHIINHGKFLPTPPADVLDISTPIKIATTRGPRFFMAVINDSADYDAMGLVSYEDVCNVVYNMSDESQYMFLSGTETTRNRGLMMVGFKEYYLTSSTTNVAIDLHRQCFRINIARITNNLPATYGSITVKYAFLTNYIDKWPVGGASYVSGTPQYKEQYGITTYVDPVMLAEDPSHPENALTKGIIDGVHVFSANAMTAIKGDLVIPVGGTSSLYSGKGLYAFPNPNQDKTWWAMDEDTWPTPTPPTIWPTRVVLAATLPDFPNTVFYYPMTPSEPLKANSTYDINVTISNLGSTSPEQELTTGTAQISVTAGDWDVDDETFIQ